MSQLDLEEMDRLRAENKRLQELVDEMQEYKDASDQWQRMYQQEADDNYDLLEERKELKAKANDMLVQNQALADIVSKQSVKHNARIQELNHLRLALAWAASCSLLTTAILIYELVAR